MKLTNICYGSFMDINSCNNKLYAIQNSEQFPGGRIVCIDKNGNTLCEYTGIGNSRQIRVMDNIAIVSCREDGLWIFDITDNKIALLSHYQTIEYATGVTLYSNFVLVSCRQYGIEIIDISNPKLPKHIGLIRIGEVQSACVYDGYLYGGIWGKMSVAVVDIHDISKPEHITDIELAGRGDGVCVKDGILYAAIGQHGRGIKNLSDTEDPFYGYGNGFEVFDVKNPFDIKLLHKDIVAKRYEKRYDTWKTYVCGNTVAVSLSSLGLYLYDTFSYELKAHIDLSKDEDNYDYIIGVSVIDGKMYFASTKGGIFRIDEGMYEQPYEYKTDKKIKCDKTPDVFSTDLLKCIYNSEHLVSDICKTDSGYAVAEGSGGISIFDNSFNKLYQYQTEGFCSKLSFANGYLYSANSNEGLCIYRYSDDRLIKISSLNDNLPVLQLKLTDDCKYVICTCGTLLAEMIDVSNVYKPFIVATRKAEQGPIYGENFASHTLDDKTVLMFWHRDGLIYFNTEGKPFYKSIFYYKHNGFMGFGPENGIDTDGKNIYYNLDGGYITLPIQNGVFADDLKLYKAKSEICGKIVLVGKYMIASERARGIVTVTDISDIEHPITFADIRTTASVEKAVCIDKRIFIPGGHAGLLELNLNI